MSINSTPNAQQQFRAIIKDSIIIGLCIVILCFLLFDCNGKKCPEPEESIVYDTVYKAERIDTVYIPRPYAVYRPGNVPEPLEKWDTIYIQEFDDLEKDLIINDYYSFYIYKDTIPNKYGNVVIEDTISRNKIISRGVTTSLNIPEVTKTITLVQPKRAAVFIGADLFGSKEELAAGYGVNLSLKTKKDRIVEVGYNQFFGGKGYFSIGYKHKISLRK